MKYIKGGKKTIAEKLRQVACLDKLEEELQRENNMYGEMLGVVKEHIKTLESPSCSEDYEFCNVFVNRLADICEEYGMTKNETRDILLDIGILTGEQSQ